MEKYKEIFNKTPIFEGIKFTEITEMLKCLNYFIKSYEKGYVIINESEKIDNIGIVLTGGLHIEQIDIDGNKNIIREINESEIFGESFSFSGANATISVTAIKHSEVLFINHDKIINPCCNCSFHNKLIQNFIIILSKKNIILNEKVNLLSSKNLREKILKYLIMQSKKNDSNSFEISFNREELASYLCSDRSSLSRELSKMQDESILSYNKNKFVLY